MFKRIVSFLKSLEDLQDAQEKPVSYNDIVEEANQIIRNNKDFIERKATQLASKKTSKFLDDLGLFTFDEEFIKELVKTQQIYQKNYICREIEHKIIIERLYLDGAKEECLSKLPEWIYEIVN